MHGLDTMAALNAEAEARERMIDRRKLAGAVAEVTGLEVARLPMLSLDLILAAETLEEAGDYMRSRRLRILAGVLEQVHCRAGGSVDEHVGVR